MIPAIRTLHLTNGSSIVPRIQEAGLEGAIVPWNDLLHEGPVPAGLGPSALREVRAGFLAGCGWGSFDDILRELEHRDAALEDQRLDEIVLWFEHDLYDQLQLIQILDRLPVDGGVRLTAVMPGAYLGRLPSRDYVTLFENRKVITSAEQLAARDAWQAFRSSDPRDVLDALPRVTALPYLRAALLRHLQQFPSARNGLSRTEQQALDAIASGSRTLRDVYVQANHDAEEATFMGDAGFLFHISSLFSCRCAMVRVCERPETESFEASNPRTLDLPVALTADGRRLMEGDADRVTCCGIDRWLGGVHLEGRGPVWRWDSARGTLRLL